MAWTPQNLPVALPIWDNYKKQTFRQPFCNSNPFLPLEMRLDRILPWIIMGESGAPDYVYLVNEATTNAIDITALLDILNGVEGGNDYAYCEGASDIDQDAEVTEHTGWNGTSWTTTPGENTWGAFVQCGKAYFLEFKFGSNRYYSDSFNIVDFPEFCEDPTDEDTARCRIEAVTTCMLDTIPPLGSQKIFIKTFTVEPEYPIDKTVSKDGSENEKIKWAKVEKRYRLRFPASEAVADFCALLPLFSVVNITDQYGLQSEVSITEQPKISWGDELGNGCVATIEIVYTRDFVETQCC